MFYNSSLGDLWLIGTFISVLRLLPKCLFRLAYQTFRNKLNYKSRRDGTHAETWVRFPSPPPKYKINIFKYSMDAIEKIRKDKQNTFSELKQMYYQSDKKAEELIES